jgi:RNA polymerase sigma-70 factor (ECF subfamily)
LDKDFELVRRITAGDINQFEQLIDSYQRLVTHIVYRMTGDQADREELCQEIFIKVYRSLATFNFNARLSTWIAKIAHNHCINYLRKNKLNLLDDMTVKDENGGEYQFSESMHSTPSVPDQESEKAELSGFLRSEIELLPEKYKLILTLYHVDELSYQDISETLEMPAGTVKSYLFRARRMLKENLIRKYRGEIIWQ